MTHRVFIPNWRPTALNQLVNGSWQKRARLKKSDREIIAGYILKAGIPKAEGKRRVSLAIVLKGRQQQADPDAYWKSLLDGLVKCGALVDDSHVYCSIGMVTYPSGTEAGTTITLEDVP